MNRWIGLLPLAIGLRLLWKWTVADTVNMQIASDDYRRARPLRISTAVGVAGLGVVILIFGS